MAFRYGFATTPEVPMTPLPRPVWPGAGDAPPGHQEAQAAKEVWFRRVQAERFEQAAEREARAATHRRQPRRIIQLCGSTRDGLSALCDDGTVWQLIGCDWMPVSAIPQRQLAED